jgi:hypothetical protein
MPRHVIRNFRVTAGALALLAAGTLHAQEERGVYFGMLYKPVCDRLIPGFEKATAVNFLAWREQHREAVQTLEADPKFKADRDAALVPPPPDILAAKTRELMGTCDRVSGIFETAAPTDARFETPERAWQTFRDALRDAKRDVVFTCLAGEARSTFVGQMRAMTDEQMKRLGESVTDIRLSPRQGNFQEAVILQRNGAAGTVVFVMAGANWKIGRM